MNILEKIKQQIAEFDEKRKVLLDELKSDFAPMLRPLFEKSNGKISSIGWKQYTPYFNDGDECVFSVDMDLDYGLTFNGESIDENEAITANTYGLSKYLAKDGSYENWISKYPKDSIDPVKDADELELYSLLLEFHELLTSIPDSFYKDLFGDHCEVTIYSDGSVNVEHYNHD